MKEFKGTPGPWFVDEFGDVSDRKEINKDAFCIAAVRGVISLERDMHNANLIAAAPELLEALQRLISDYDRYKSVTVVAGTHDEPQQIQDARAAIAKALGESK